MTTLTETLERASRYEYGVRFLDRQERALYLTYREIRERAARTAGGLRSLGLAPGARVAIVLPTGPDFFDAFYGTLLAGGVPVPLYPPVRLGRLDEYHARTAAMLAAVSARAVLTSDALRRVLGRSVAGALSPPAAGGSPEPIGDGGGAPSPRKGAPATNSRGVPLDLGCVTIGGIPRGALPEHRPAADDVALIQFSSGTTVEPKPVRLTHRQILANVDVIVSAITGRFPEEGYTHSGVSWLPLYHDMGLVGAVFTALARPRDLTLIPPELFVARPALWLRAISRYRATVSAAPHFAYSFVSEKVRDTELEGVDLSSWRLALDGAEPVTPAVLERFNERFKRYGLRPEALTPVYGLAEAALAVCFSEPLVPFDTETFDREGLLLENRARRAREGERLVSLGRPLPGYAIRIMREDGAEAEEGELGQVFVRGPSLMEGYEALPELTSSVLKDGWLDTGDWGFLNRGKLYLYGRKKDLVIVNGRKYAPQDVENAVAGVPGTRTGCVAAIGVIPDGRASESLVVLLERRPGISDDAEIARAARERIVETTGLVPDNVVVLAPGTLPRTSSGKIRRGEARRLYLARALAAPRPVTKLRLLGELVRSRWAFMKQGMGG